MKYLDTDFFQNAVAIQTEESSRISSQDYFRLVLKTTLPDKNGKMISIPFCVYLVCIC